MYIITDDQWAKETGQYRLLRSQIIDLSYEMLKSYFNCPPFNPTDPGSDESAARPSNPQFRDFIYNAVHRTRTPLAAIVTAVILIRRLRDVNSNCSGTDITPHRVMLAAIILSCKLLYDDTYSNKTWVHVSQNLFTLDVINRMEWEFCSYLDFKLAVDRHTWMHHTHDLANDLALVHGHSSSLLHDLNSIFVEPDTLKLPHVLQEHHMSLLPTPSISPSVIPMPYRPFTKRVPHDGHLNALHAKHLPSTPIPPLSAYFMAIQRAPASDNKNSTPQSVTAPLMSNNSVLSQHISGAHPEPRRLVPPYPMPHGGTSSNLYMPQQRPQHGPAEHMYLAGHYAPHVPNSGTIQQNFTTTTAGGSSGGQPPQNLPPSNQIRPRITSSVSQRARVLAGLANGPPHTRNHLLHQYQLAQLQAQQQLSKRGDSGTDLAAVHQHNQMAAISGAIGGRPMPS